MKKIVLIGGGGHCKSVIDAIESMGEFEIVGITDPLDKGTILNIDILGGDDLLQSIFDSGVRYAFVTLGSVGDPTHRIKLHNMLKSLGFSIPIIIDNTAILSSYTNIGEGTFIGKGVIINSDATIGIQTIINSGSIIEHDCTIGDYVHIAPGCAISGSVNIGFNSHIGTGSKIIEGISIGNNTLIGAGTVVVNSFGDGLKIYGNPGRIK